MPATKFEKGKVTEKVDPKVLGVLSAAFGYKISGVDDLDYEEYHNELREAMARGKGTLSPAQMAVLSSERTRIRAQKSVYKADFKKTTMTAADIKRGSAIQLAERSASSLYKGGVGQSPVEEDIHEPLDEILRLLKEEHQLEKDKAEAARKKAEDEARARKEKNLERWNSLKKTASKVVKPFRSLWDKIWGFLKTIILGNILMKILDWMGDKKNQEKLKNIFKFMKDWWPTLLAAYLLFGNSLGRMIVKLTAKVAVWTVKIVSQLIPQLMAALTKLKTGKLLKMLGGKRSKALLMTGSLLAATPGLVNRFTDSGEETETTSITPTENGDASKYFSEFREGGVVRGSSGVDKVPARLTAGEFVMSKGAVEKWGASTLASMNAMGGGTNIPSFSGGVSGYFGGGEVIQPNKKEKELIDAGTLYSPIVKPGTIDSYADAIKAGVKIDDSVVGNMRSGSLNWTERSPKGLFGRKKKYVNVGTKWIHDGIGIEHQKTLEMSTKDFVNQRMGWTADSPGGGILSSVKKGVAGGISAAKNLVAGGVKDVSIPGPPSTSKNKETLNIVKQQDQEKVSGDQSGGVKIPSFDAEKYVSTQKMKTLGLG